VKKKASNVLPLSCPPRGFSRDQAAEYIGVSTSLFDEMVTDGRMPGPKRINSRVVWDKLRLDAAFDALPDRDQTADDQWKVAA
jgi:predicted DNA-binding transcriptional regulator AlpA